MGTILCGVYSTATMCHKLPAALCQTSVAVSLSICSCMHRLHCIANGLQIHKIMAGLFDQYTFTGDELALHIVVNMAAYFTKRVDETLRVNGTDHWHQMLNNEFGGMSEVLHNLYGVTKDKKHLRSRYLLKQH